MKEGFQPPSKIQIIDRHLKAVWEKIQQQHQKTERRPITANIRIEGESEWKTIELKEIGSQGEDFDD